MARNVIAPDAILVIGHVEVRISGVLAGAVVDLVEVGHVIVQSCKVCLDLKEPMFSFGFKQGLRQASYMYDIRVHMSSIW